MKIYSQKVVENLNAMESVFSLTSKETVKGIKMIEKIGYQTAKPSTIALVVIRILRPGFKSRELYKKGKTEYNTMKKWTIACCKILKVRQRYY